MHPKSKQVEFYMGSDTENVNKLKEHEEICNSHDSCHIEMPGWANETIKYNPGEKSLEAPFSFFLDLECKFKKLQSIQNNPEKS